LFLIEIKFNLRIRITLFTYVLVDKTTTWLELTSLWTTTCDASFAPSLWIRHGSFLCIQLISISHSDIDLYYFIFSKINVIRLQINYMGNMHIRPVTIYFVHQIAIWNPRPTGTKQHQTSYKKVRNISKHKFIVNDWTAFRVLAVMYFF